MRRKFSPVNRKRIKKNDISFDLSEKNGRLALTVRINLESYGFPRHASVRLEVSTKFDVQIIDLGGVREHNENKFFDCGLLNFPNSARETICFKVKVIDPETYELLGYVEKLKEQRTSESLLSSSFKEMPLIYKIEYDEGHNPIIYLNSELKRYMPLLQPLFAEIAFREILGHFIEKNDDEIWGSEFGQLINKYCKINEDEIKQSKDRGEGCEELINEIARAFSEKAKTKTTFLKYLERRDHD